MTPRQAALAVERIAKKLESELQKAEAKTLNFAYLTARRLSSGPFSLQELEEMGHPYSRRNPTSPDPEVINVQTGAFKSDWTKKPGTWQGDTLTSSLINDNHVADLLNDGTPLMIRRPIVDAIEEKVAPVRLANLQTAIDRATK